MNTTRQSEPPAWDVFKRACELQRAGRISDALDVFYAVMMTCGWHRTDIDFGRNSPRGWITACEDLIRARTLLATLSLVVDTQEQRDRLDEKRDRWIRVAEQLLDKGGFEYAHGPKRWRTLRDDHTAMAKPTRHADW
jgi:hypothetical protein